MFLAVFHFVSRKLDLVLLLMEFRASSRFPFLSMRNERQILELARFVFRFILSCLPMECIHKVDSCQHPEYIPAEMTCTNFITP